MVWSMNVIETTKIIAVRTRFFERLPAALACAMPPPAWLCVPGSWLMRDKEGFRNARPETAVMMSG